MLRRRAQLLKQLRAFFDDRDFLEVETPLVSRDTVVDRHLDPIPVTLFEDPRVPETGRRMWLQTSPEFAMKRLLAAGGQRIYQVAKAFRGGERGRFHNPEFTIVEWYQVGATMAEGMALLADLVMELLQFPEVGLISYGDAFQQTLGVNAHTATVSELAAVAHRASVVVPANMPPDDRDEWLNVLLAGAIEPRLGAQFPQILFDYPASQAALAQVRNEDPPVASRFELYIRGLELANGYHELLDANILRERNLQNNRWRQVDGKYTVPEDSLLLAAMDRGLPDCVGVALGFDRLVMLATGAECLQQVMAFDVEIA